jgi:hypothetical protein
MCAPASVTRGPRTRASRLLLLLLRGPRPRRIAAAPQGEAGPLDVGQPRHGQIGSLWRVSFILQCALWQSPNTRPAPPRALLARRGGAGRESRVDAEQVGADLRRAPVPERRFSPLIF